MLSTLRITAHPVEEFQVRHQCELATLYQRTRSQHYIESQRHSRASTMRRIFCFCSVAGFMLLAGCASETLFQSNFDSTSVGHSRRRMSSRLAQRTLTGLRAASWSLRHRLRRPATGSRSVVPTALPLPGCRAISRSFAGMAPTLFRRFSTSLPAVVSPRFSSRRLTSR